MMPNVQDERFSITQWMIVRELTKLRKISPTGFVQNVSTLLIKTREGEHKNQRESERLHGVCCDCELPTATTTGITFV